MSDRAPVVYDEDGSPMRVRVVGAECVGDVSGDGQYFGYEGDDLDPAFEATVFFEPVSGGGPQ